MERLENSCYSWVCAPATRPGIGLLTAAAQGGGAGIFDLGTAAPLHWGAAADNAHLLQRHYPVAQALGVRLAARHLAHFLATFPLAQERTLFFILAGPPDDLPVEATAALGGHTIYAEIDSRATLEAVAQRAADQQFPLAGFVAVAADSPLDAGRRSAFILAQELAGAPLPVWLKGGVGLHTAATLPLAGLRGVVLDSQVLLFPGSPLRPDELQRLATVDAQAFHLLGQEIDAPLLVPHLPWLPAATELVRAYEVALRAGNYEQLRTLVAEARNRACFGTPAATIWPVGPAVSLAASYLRQYRTLPAFLQALEQRRLAGSTLASQHGHLLPNAALAQSHGTRYAVVQGPMTRVCDTPAFARAVAEAGALPFVALALLEGTALTDLLTQTATELQGRSWGAGLLGFLPDDLREEQLRALLAARPGFALIAGGTAGQAQRLEAEGITTYLHVPSPAILQLFVEAGCRRFIFEGRECGGHVGPTASLLLWDQMVAALLDTVPAEEFADLHVLFAGGIHDARSSAMVAVSAAPLAERGARTGILMGTAYLACQEAVESGALTEVFQQQLLAQADTTLLVSGPGHANRCLTTAFAQEFNARRTELLASSASNDEIARTLDELLLGRLRIATKGIQRVTAAGYEAVEPAAILAGGMFMAGDAVRFIEAVGSCAALHADVTTGGLACLEPYVRPDEASAVPTAPVDIAIVGMSTIVPGSDQVERFWATVLERTRHLREVPADRWDWRVLMREGLPAKDSITSAWGGFIDDLLFDPLKYGIPPKSVPNIASAQLLGLELVSRALDDAHLELDQLDRENTSVIFATADAGGFLANALTVRSTLPVLAAGQGGEALHTPEWTEETFAGILCNVVPGRVANRLDFGGRNYAVDAACASSLVAVDLGVRELQSHRSNVVLVGGVDVGQTPFGYLAFSNTGALSPSGQSLPFDQRGDGIVISEGGAALVLKRLDDAERAGDRIYAVIKGIAGSSDGRAMGLTAPRSEGQQLALRRAYQEAGIRPRQIGFYEAHGTGTPVGDREELQTVCRTLLADGAAPRSVALSSVKSLIGHTKMAAGMVSLAKAALALYYKVLPSQSELQQPLALLQEAACPLAVQPTPTPWLDPAHEGRRAGVSAFGFGGANFHAVLQEHAGYAASRKLGADAWPSELLVFGAAHREALLADLRQLAAELRQPLALSLRDLAFSLAAKYFEAAPEWRLSFACTSLPEALAYLEAAAEALQAGVPLPSAISFSQVVTTKAEPRVAFLFPGQGSQYLDMGKELALYFPEFRAETEAATSLLAAHYPQALWHYLFPTADFTIDRAAQEAALRDTHVAQPAIGLHSAALLDLLARLGVRPDFVAGHSFGEFTALHAAGVFGRDDFYRLAEFRGRVMQEMATGEGTMLAVFAGRAEVEAHLAAANLAVAVANHNAPNQVAVSGSTAAVAAAARSFADAGISCLPLPVSAAFHSPLMREAAQPLADRIRATPLAPARVPVFSNQSGQPYPAEADAVHDQLADHLLGTVEFVRQVEAMRQVGATLFLEVGPGEVLTKLVRKCLPGDEVAALPLDAATGGLAHLLATVGRLWVAGLPVDLSQLFADRDVQLRPLPALRRACAARSPRPTDWWINGHLPKPANPAFRAYLPPSVITPLSTPPANHVPAQFSDAMASSTPEMPALTPTEPWRAEAAHYPAPDQAPLPTDATLAVYQAYQDTMRQFLRTQEAVMQVLLTGQAAPVAYQPAPAPVAYQPAPPVYQPAPLPMPAPRPVTPAPVQAAPVPQLTAPSVREAAPVAPAPAPATDFSAAGVQRILMELVSERTGYPLDMIKPDMDLEKDLGVDSIKRMEIVGNFLKLAPAGQVRQLNGRADQFVRLKRLRELSELIANALQEANELAAA